MGHMMIQGLLTNSSVFFTPVRSENLVANDLPLGALRLEDDRLMRVDQAGHSNFNIFDRVITEESLQANLAVESAYQKLFDRVKLISKDSLDAKRKVGGLFISFFEQIGMSKKDIATSFKKAKPISGFDGDVDALEIIVKSGENFSDLHPNIWVEDLYSLLNNTYLERMNFKKEKFTKFASFETIQNLLKRAPLVIEGLISRNMYAGKARLCVRNDEALTLGQRKILGWRKGTPKKESPEYKKVILVGVQELKGLR